MKTLGQLKKSAERPLSRSKGFLHCLLANLPLKKLRITLFSIFVAVDGLVNLAAQGLHETEVISAAES
jgi:hypothetical protein